MELFVLFGLLYLFVPGSSYSLIPLLKYGLAKSNFTLKSLQLRNEFKTGKHCDVGNDQFVYFISIHLECFSNGTVMIGNPDKNQFHFVMLTSVNNECTYSFSDDFGILTLDNCRKNTYAQLLFRKDTSMIIRKGTFAGPFGFVCRAPEPKDIVADYGFILNISSNGELGNATEIHEINSSLGDGNSNQTHDVTLGGAMEWKFEIPAKHTAKAQHCTAYPGATPSGDESIVLIQDGCSLDLLLASNLERTDNSAQHYSAKFAIFQYDKESEFVTIVCRVRICHDDAISKNCTVDCSSPQRKKRNAPSLLDDMLKDGLGTMEGSKGVSAAPSVNANLLSISRMIYPVVLALLMSGQYSM